jgi:maleylacetate reductase
MREDSGVGATEVMHFVHDVPASRVIFGPGGTAQIGDEVARLGVARALLITRPSLEVATQISRALGPAQVGRFTDVEMHVPAEVAARAVARARAVGADVVVAVGGGSAIGTAKAIAKETGLPIIAIPTTYAGSEMTPIWGLTDATGKTTGRDRGVLPKVVIYDPELTLSLPPDLSAASGMNALAHLVEGLYATHQSPLARRTAEEGIRALAASLPVVVREPTNLEARSEMLYAAWLAGWTLGNARMAIHHKICHALGGTFNLPHAPTHSAVLPYAAAANAQAAPAAMASIERALVAAGLEVDHVPGALWDLRRAVGAPEALAPLGLSPDDIDAIAEIVVAARPDDPEPVDLDLVRGILDAAMAGARPGLP